MLGATLNCQPMLESFSKECHGSLVNQLVIYGMGLDSWALQVLHGRISFSSSFINVYGKQVYVITSIRCFFFLEFTSSLLVEFKRIFMFIFAKFNAHISMISKWFESSFTI